MTDHVVAIKDLTYAIENAPSMGYAWRQEVVTGIRDHTDALTAERDALLAYARELEYLITREDNMGEIVVFNARTACNVAHLLDRS